MSDFKARYASAALHSSMGGAVSQILYGLTPVIIARYLGPRDYGVYSIVMSLVAIVTGLLSLGQNSMLHKLLPEYSVKDREMGGAILANTALLTGSVLAILSVGFLAMSGWLAGTVYRDGRLTNVFRWAVAATLALALFNLASSAVAGLQNFKIYNRGLLLRSIALIGLMWIGVQWYGLTGALAGQVLASLLGLTLVLVYGWPLAMERFPGFIRLSRSGVLWKIMAGFTLPTLLMTLLNLPGFWWISTMVARHTNFTEAGHFGVGYAIAQLIFLVPQTLYTPAMTFMSEAHSDLADEHKDRFRQVVGTNLRWIWALSLPLALGGALASPLIINALFGSDYAAAIPSAFVMSLAALLMTNTGLLNTAIIAAGHAWQGCVITMFWAVIFFAAGWFCIPRWGALGGAVAFTISQGFYFAGTYLYSRRTLRITSDGLGRLALLTMLSAAAAIFVTFTLQGSAFYFASLVLLLGVLTAEWSWISVETERRQLQQATAGIKWNRL